MGSILVVYYSGTGNTRKMAELVAEGAEAVGGHEVRLADVRDLDLAELVAADAFAFGSPDYFTYMAGEVKTLFDRALSQVEKLKGKPFVSFVSHGGGGGAIESLDRLGKAVGLKQVCDGVKSQGAPSGKAVEACRKLGSDLAGAVS
ncbi:MAG TPA: flavodoxin domain-containing protein [Planctomycetota bacterium]|nr:flavodoxin domain-containing protein [Planctomycetota bacterium]